MKFKTYLTFDLDGTLYDASPVIEESFAGGIRIYNAAAPDQLKVPDRQEILNVVGLPLVELFGALFPGLDRIELQKINDACMFELIKLVRKKRGILIEGVGPTLKLLHDKGFPMFIASNGRTEYIEAVLETYSLDHYFQKPIIAPNTLLPTKSDVVREYMKQVPGNNHLIMIGDRTSDRLAAEDNDIPFIGCSFGHAGESEISGSRWVAHSFSEIIGLVEEIVREEEMTVL